MKQTKLILGVAVLAAVFGVGIAHGAGVIDATKKLGGAVGGVFRLDGQMRMRSLFVRDDVQITGPIKNGTRTVGVKNPVLVNDDLKVTGTITGNLTGNVTGSVTGNTAGSVGFTTTATGLVPTNVQGAIDELGVSLADLIAGANIVASGVTTSSVVTASTWKGNSYDVCATTFRKSADITAVFTPTSKTEGSYSVSPNNIFQAVDQACNSVATGTFTGTYDIIGDTILVKPASGTNQVVPVTVHGVTMNIIDYKSATPPNVMTTLTRQ